LRDWLKNYYIKSIPIEYQSRIAITRNVYKNEDGKDCWINDRVFLLIVDEVLKYFSGLKPFDPKVSVSLYKEDDRLIASLNNKSHYQFMYNTHPYWGLLPKDKPIHWWLRSIGSSPSFAAYVMKDGSLCAGGFRYTNTSVGVRPCLWLNID